MFYKQSILICSITGHIPKKAVKICEFVFFHFTSKFYNREGFVVCNDSADTLMFRWG